MTRTQFLGLFAIPFLPKIDLEQKGKSIFNIKKLKARLKFLLECPLKVGDKIVIYGVATEVPFSSDKVNALGIQNIIQEDKNIRVFIEASDHYNNGLESPVWQGQFGVDKNERVYYVLSTDKINAFNHSMLLHICDL